ncbi:Carcinine [Hypsibius exemplaris]|uniref:Carcinine n=1 Tax=Hypsibius exemplaris TaxID=2072580 RepID=A0A1W0WG70_HYPEX|nr:Carcinine [Hypsibius exemplaris]
MSGSALAPDAPKRNFDDLLTVVGSYGRYQILMAFLVILPAVLPSGFLSMTSIFLAATPLDFWCNIPPENVSSHTQSHVWVPRFNSSHTKTCQMYLVDTEDALLIGNQSIAFNQSRKCDSGIQFNHDVYESTIVTEWKLVCDQASLRTWTFTIFTIGGMTGPLIWGFLADRYGRKRAFFLCVTFQSIFAVGTAFAPSYVWFCIFRFFVGSTTSAGYTLPFVLLLEITGPESRAFFSVLLSCTYSVGGLLFLAIAYYVRAWKSLALISSLASASIYMTVWWFFPESPRWLLSRGRYDDLTKFLLRVAKLNGRPVTAEFRSHLPVFLRKVDKEDHTKTHSILDLFKTPNMRKKTLILVFLNICNKGVSLGLNYYAPLLSSTPHWDSFLNAIVELPPYFFAKTAFNRLGRRLSLFLGLSIGGMACLTTYAIPAHLTGPFNVILMLSLIAKFCITFTYLGGKLFEDEQFPTVVRGEGHSVVSVLSSSISCGVPFIVDLGHAFRILPLLVFGSLCLLAALSVFFLPETAHQRLPQTLEDGEQFGKNLPWREMFRLLPRRLPPPFRANVPVGHGPTANGSAAAPHEMEKLNPTELTDGMLPNGPALKTSMA